MRKILAILFCGAISLSALACPNCHLDVANKNKPPYTLMIIGAFIILIYIPFYILFNASRKYDPNRQNAND